jgi:hypothetical protein
MEEQIAYLNKNLKTVTEKNVEFEKMHAVWQAFMGDLQKISLNGNSDQIGSEIVSFFCVELVILSVSIKCCIVFSSTTAVSLYVFF